MDALELFKLTLNFRTISSMDCVKHYLDTNDCLHVRDRFFRK